MSTNIRYIYTSIYTYTYKRESVQVKIIRLSHIVHKDDDDDYVFSFLYMNMRVHIYTYILNDRSNRARIKNDSMSFTINSE